MLLTRWSGDRDPPQEPITRVRMFEIEDFNYFGSTVGNAYFSGLTLEQLWSCVSLSETREQLDEAVSATIRLNKITRGCSVK